MAKKIYEEENIRAIAEKIREKTGGNSAYKTADMPGAIEDVFEAENHRAVVTVIMILFGIIINRTETAQTMKMLLRVTVGMPKLLNLNMILSLHLRICCLDIVI